MILSIAGLGVSYFLFLLLLKQEKNFLFIRFYLLGSLILCLISPVLHIDWGLDLSPVKQIKIAETFDLFEQPETPEKETVTIIKRDTSVLGYVLIYFYGFMTLILLIRFLKNGLTIIDLIKKGRIASRYPMKLIVKEEKGNPFSFFNYLFIHPEDLEDEDYFQSVLSHELSHSKEFHSLDVIFTELLSCFFWFNPFVWLYKREIIENHEFLADSHVVRSGMDTDSYSLQLIRSGARVKQPFISGFSFINTKNRLNMMYKKKSPKTLILLKICLIAFLFSGVFAISSFTPSGNSNPFVVVVDAGHGGKDRGNSNEKDINLQISKILYSLSKKNEVEIILLREDDRWITLEERVNFVNAQKPDLLLSLHCNNAQDSDKKGLQVFYAPKGFAPESALEYSKILVEHQVKELHESGEIKTANFRVLREASVPAVLLEMGFLSNPSDVELLQDPESQQKIAEALYDGLLEIRSKVKN